MPPILVTYLTQFSTWSGLIKLACAFGLFTATPQIQNEMATDAVQFVAAILALLGTIDTLRNERKGSTVPTNTTQPKG